MSFSVILLSLSSLALILGLAVLALRRLEAPGAQEFGLIALLGSVWAGGALLELLAPSFQVKLLGRNLTQVGVYLLPAANLAFALAFSGARATLRRAIATVSFAFQAIPLALVWSDGLHHLMREAVWLSPLPGGLTTVEVRSTTLGSVFGALDYVLVLYALGILLVYAFKNRGPLRRQVLLAVLGLGLPTVYTGLRSTVASGALHNLSSSASFVLGGILILGSMYGTGFLRLTPVARERAFDVIDEGIIVLDPQARVMDANPSARAMFALHLPNATGSGGLRAIETFLRAQEGLTREEGRKEGGFAFTLPHLDGRGQANYRFKMFELRDGRRLSGYVGVLRDVTKETRQADLLRLKAERDCLTGIYNRSAFIDLVTDCALRHEGGGFLLLFDVDGFKAFNDSFGHLAGDAVLKGICETCRATLRDEDIFGRVGGDEFAIFLQGLEEANAHKLAERLRARVEESPVSFEGRAISVTISVGLARQLPTCDGEGKKLAFEALFSRADAALYRSKTEGRNRVSLAGPSPR